MKSKEIMDNGTDIIINTLRSKQILLRNLCLINNMTAMETTSKSEPNILISNSQAKWIKFAKINNFSFVGREACCLMAGCHMLFINLITKEEHILRANDRNFAEGIGCIAGHKTMNVFAFSEMIKNPRIIVQKYPDFKTISSMKENSENYLSMTFSETELLLALTGFPTCELQIWKWRTAMLLTRVETELLFSNQILKANFTAPVHVLQCVENTNQLLMWEIAMCGKKCIVMKEKIVFRDRKILTLFVNAIFTTDGSMFVLDSEGHVYMMAHDKKLDRIITCETEGPGFKHFAWFQGGIILNGCNRELKHYEQSGEFVCKWTKETDVELKQLLAAAGRDYMIAISNDEDMLIFNNETKAFELLRTNESGILDCCIINPLCEYLITLGHYKKMIMWKFETGEQVDILHTVDAKVLKISSNPSFPYFAASYDNGYLDFYACINEKMTIMCKFHLTHNPLDKISFSEGGKLITVCDMRIGQFFVIEGFPGGKFSVLTSVTANRQIADYIMIGARSCLKLFMVFVTSDKYIAGNMIARYCIMKHSEPTLKLYDLENPNRYYGGLYITRNTPVRDRFLYAVPLDNKNLHELELRRGETQARIVKRIKSQHMMKKIYYQMTEFMTISYAYDGLIFVMSTDMDSVRDIVMPHHRLDGGIQLAYANPYAKHIVSLGRDGTLVCTHLTDVEPDEPIKKLIQQQMEDYLVMFSSPSVGFLPTGAYEGATWIDYKIMIQNEVDRIKYEAERQSILDEFREVQNAASDLLTRNLNGPENETLPIQDFNLYFELKEERVKASKEECDRTKLYLQKLIAEHNRITDALKVKFWDTISIPTRNLCAIFGNFDVQSYCILPPDVAAEERIKRIEEYRKIEKLLSKDDSFHPWIAMSDTELDKKFQSEPKLPIEQKLVVTDEFEDEDLDNLPEEQAKIEREKKAAMFEHQIAMSGSTVNCFIQANSGHYEQIELQTFLQHSKVYDFSMDDQQQLREFFNKKFEGVFQTKIKEMTTIIERNARLRYIISEINYFSKKQLNIEFCDPEWLQEENPELLTKVENSEVGVLPYISPSEQAILDAAAAEAERIRLLMLADDFKERALMKMMNGVLEVRWEDELRIEVPKPKCMLEKEPENFNEEDLKAVRDYEEKVAFLHSERERYKSILSNEYSRLGNQLREGVKKFNEKLQELLILKLQVEFSISAEYLRINRLRYYDIERLKLDAEENEASAAIHENELKSDYLHTTLSSFGEFIGQLKTNLEFAQSKDKYIDKSFRKEFQEATAAQLEILLKLYKKRPKSNIRLITSSVILWELSKCIVGQGRTIVLNNDALEFLKMMEVLDKFVGIPNAIDSHLYANLCKLRRLKVESELKIRSIQLELQEAESTRVLFHNGATACKEANQQLVLKLTTIRKKKLHTAANVELQIILKEGFVELPRTGTMDDFKDAIMVSRSNVEEINAIVIDAGRKKLSAMRSAMTFKREIMMSEWLHKKKKMEIADLEKFYVDIGSVKLTKEIQEYLKFRSRGEQPDKGTSFEQEVQNQQENFDRELEKIRMKIINLDETIKSVKADNVRLNLEVMRINVDVTERRQNCDATLEERESKLNKLKMSAYLKRSKLISLIQSNHQEILVLQSELEMLRMRTIPILDYQIN